MINTIIFDLGAVLIDWNPAYLYRKIFTGEEEMNNFLTNVTNGDWNEEQDGGRSLAEATDVLISKFPEHEENIRAYYTRWEEMLNGPIDGTVELFKMLKASKKYKIYALTNWSAETFPIALEKFDFLQWFDGIVVSGTEKMRKPSPQFYQLLLDRYNLKASDVLFIDDNQRNVIAAEKMGMEAIQFMSPQQLRYELKAHDLI